MNINLGHKQFATKSAASKHFKEILGRYDVGQIVGLSDCVDLAALLKRHSEYEQKIGAGLFNFEVMRPLQGGKCFKINRIDGSSTDFSYLHCINGTSPQIKQEVSAALREVVHADIQDAKYKFFHKLKNNNGLVACAETGALVPYVECHVDHRPPLTFEIIVWTFLAGRNIDFGDVPMTARSDNQTVTKITNKEFAEEFRLYHARVALLDFVKSSTNLSNSAKYRLKTARIKL